MQWNFRKRYFAGRGFNQDKELEIPEIQVHRFVTPVKKPCKMKVTDF